MTQRFRLHLDGDYAPQERLDAVAEILVEQELDAIWEAKIKFEICLDDQGSWEDDLNDYLGNLTRARIELQLGDHEFAPLIDGPIIGQESNLSSEPGQSTLTLIIADDSIYLNQSATYDPHEGRKPHEIAETIFSNSAQISETEIDSVDRITEDLQDADVQNETDLQFLRRLGRRHNRFVFIRPGNTAGSSIAHFKDAPTSPSSDVEALVLLGSGRNLQSFNLEQDNQQPREVTASSLSFGDKTVLTRTSSSLSQSVFASDNLQGVDPSAIGLDFLPAALANSPDPDEAVNAQASRSRFQYEATGNLIPGCYSSILSPFQLVNVRAGNTPLSGHYLIKKVTHRLDRNRYTQDFTAMRDGALSGSGGSILPNIF